MEGVVTKRLQECPFSVLQLWIMECWLNEQLACGLHRYVYNGEHYGGHLWQSKDHLCDHQTLPGK